MSPSKDVSPSKDGGVGDTATEDPRCVITSPPAFLGAAEDEAVDESAAVALPLLSARPANQEVRNCFILFFYDM